MEYGVQTHNKFAFLDDDVDVSDPEEALTKKVEEAKKAAAAVPAAPSLKKVTVQPQAASKSLTQKENEKPRAPTMADDKKKANEDGGKGMGRIGGGKGRNEGGRGQNGPVKGDQRFGGNREQQDGGQGQRGPRQPRQNFSNRSDKSADGNKENPKEVRQFREGMDNNRGPRRGAPRVAGGGGRGGSRGGGNFRNDQNRNRSSDAENKEFVEKKQENENENSTWGTTNDTWGEENTEGITNNEKPAEVEKSEDAVAEENNKLETEVEVEQQPREKIYEEWKAEQQQKNAEKVNFNTRKAGEGADQKIYQKLVPIKQQPDKKTEQEEFDEATQHKEKREKPLQIDVSFVDKRNTGGYGSGGGSRGFGNDRGGGGGNRGFGADRGGGERSYGGGGGGRGDRSFRGNRGGGERGSGPRGGHGNYGGGGSAANTSRRQQASGFTLENEQFPALGAH